jgi:LmbE family N-acetylglucosaminyl deacetylase
LIVNKIVTKRRILKLFNFLPWNEQFIKIVEFARGLYQYPDKMIGRKVPANHNKSKTDVLIFAAHSDDDVLGLGATLYRHCKKGENVKVVFTTNGSADWSGVHQSWNIKAAEATLRAETRFREAVDALSLLHIPEENILCLGYPDGGTQRYLENISEDVLLLIQKLNPGKIYVHCIEGGHTDHDMTSLAVKFSCNKAGYHNVFEWAEYNPEQPIGSKEIRFLPNSSKTFQEITIEISDEERELKRKMLSCHPSQNVEQYFTQGEAIRRANLFQLETELLEYCQLPKSKLASIVKHLNKSLLYQKYKNAYEVNGFKENI